MTGVAPPVFDAEQGPVAQDDHVRGVRLPIRLYASKHTHRLIPARVALALVASVGPAVRQRRNPAERRDAERFMADLLLYTPRAGEARTLARRWLAEKSRLRELFWRPWLLEGSRVIGAEHWQAARAGGGGSVVVFGHFVAAWAVPAILGLRGFDHYVVVSPHYWWPMPSGYSGLALLHRRIEYGERPLGKSRLVPSDTRPDRLVQLLAAGASVGIAFDVPGSAPTPFLGRSVALSGGAATLALRTGAKILPVIPERHGARLDLRMLAPLDPGDHRDTRTLRAAIARTFEPFVLAKPEIVELAWYPSPLVTEALPSAADGDGLDLAAIEP